MPLASDEFIRRFLIHVHRLRHYGLLANGVRAETIARARELLGRSAIPGDPADADADEPLAHPCPCCRAA
jgi:hypothetical protein